MTPSISIITVTFNAASALPTLLESLRAQVDRDFEWVVMDAASTDGTVDILQAAGDVLWAWRSEPDFGIYDAMNKALRLASGEYYLVCGADDRLAPTAVADYREAIRKTSADVISACAETDAGIRRPGLGQSWRYGHAAFVSYHSVGTLIRRSLHERFGYYSRRFPIAADQYFLKQVCMAPTVKFVTADFVAGHYSLEGMSGCDIPGTMSEFFRIQLETERYAAAQVILYGLRMLCHFGRLVAYGKAKRTAAR
jgi:glycosyltransferase involved in cell wall biosynthesis